MACGVEVDVLGITCGIHCAEHQYVLFGDALAFVGLQVGDVDQIERCGRHEGLASCGGAVVALGYAGQRLFAAVVAVDALFENGIDRDGVERQCRRRGQLSVRAVLARCGPQYARKLFEREFLGAELPPRAASGKRLVDRRSGLGRRCGECDAFGHLDGGGRRLGRLCRARSQQGGCDEKQVFHG